MRCKKGWLVGFCLFPVLVFAAWINVPGQAIEQEIQSLVEQLEHISEDEYRQAYEFMSRDFKLGSLNESDGLARNLLVRIVSYGSEAVPVLLEHLGDDQETLITLSSNRDAILGLFNTFDYNTKTEPRPDGVNSSHKRQREYTVKVGDLCFFALGLIVNRIYMRNYEENYLSSPVEYRELRDVANQRWKDFYDQELLATLLSDLRRPDHSFRVFEAYRRIAYFFPDQAKAIVLEELATPCVDLQKAERFCRLGLYRSPRPGDYQRRYGEFIAVHGQHYKNAILRRLFLDLKVLEEFEAAGKVITPHGERPREVLIRVFDYPEDIKSSQMPDALMRLSQNRQSLLNVLDCSASNDIENAVKRLCLENRFEPMIQASCINSLYRNGSTQFVVRFLNEMDFDATNINDFELEYYYFGQSQIIRIAADFGDAEVDTALNQLLRRIPSDKHFNVARKFLNRLPREDAVDIAREYLSRLPDETTDGENALGLVLHLAPDQAPNTIKEYLKPATIGRVQQVLALFGRKRISVSLEVLPPLLTDKRKIPSRWLRVCDLAAQTISNALQMEEFNVGRKMSDEERNKRIESLIEYLDSLNQW